MSVKFKFNEDAIKEAALQAAKEKANTMTFDVECPHCHASINVPEGESVCPVCGDKVNLHLNFGF